jgi:hypothetical protein
MATPVRRKRTSHIGVSGGYLMEMSATVLTAFNNAKAYNFNFGGTPYFTFNPTTEIPSPILNNPVLTIQYDTYNFNTGLWVPLATYNDPFTIPIDEIFPPNTLMRSITTRANGAVIESMRILGEPAKRSGSVYDDEVVNNYVSPNKTDDIYGYLQDFVVPLRFRTYNDISYEEIYSDEWGHNPVSEQLFYVEYTDNARMEVTDALGPTTIYRPKYRRDFDPVLEYISTGTPLISNYIETVINPTGVETLHIQNHSDQFDVNDCSCIDHEFSGVGVHRVEMFAEVQVSIPDGVGGWEPVKTVELTSQMEIKIVEA